MLLIRAKAEYGAGLATRAEAVLSSVRHTPSLRGWRILRIRRGGLERAQILHSLPS